MNFLDRRVTGYKKLQKGLACEDDVYIKELNDCVIMACADGHGDYKCKFASRGAELATRIAVSELEKYYKESESIEELGQTLNDNRSELAKRIVCSWVGSVLDDYKINNPNNESFASQYKELRKYSNKIFEIRDGAMPAKEFKQLAEYRHNCEDSIYKITLLYGTTVNAVVMNSRFVFAIGIGDGDIIAVNNKRVEWLLPFYPRFNSTSCSLCGSFGTIIDNFSAIYVPITSGRKLTDSRFVPELVMIATDGLRNAFLSDEEFMEKMLEIASAFKKGDGYNFVKNSKQWLEERTRYGVTQDDISFCMCTKYNLKRKRKGAK